MTALQIAQLHELLAHDVFLIAKCLMFAATLTFAWMVAPYWINGGPRR